ncbi:glucose-methanol-choline oxidoreductase-like protein [Massariosphaeria phaeospora]|uniref:Glucose-methanol-choline oxidoreductase-like protein n=1 Tax=Massariosphaeria phaeospora TaxID=100035 RepID=A0A7C8M6G4_9PLEO|nr:glucose-methanol-choline oxidoreductase-like protein [Massariosphaeria phaeospora]
MMGPMVNAVASLSVWLQLAFVQSVTTAAAKEYDYIIVGGGTAGLVLANRLSANAAVQVLVLEAGGNDLVDPRSVIPALWQSALGTTLDWDYLTTPQPGLNSRAIGQPQGRSLGGSSAINGLAYIPPSAIGIDQWSKLGNNNWDWDTLEPYYTKSRNVTYPTAATSAYLGLDATLQSGSAGPVHVSYSGKLDEPIPAAWLQAFQQLGWGGSANPFSGKVTGGFTCAGTIDAASQTRSHAGTAYYAPVATRANLEVRTGALVEKILLRKEGADVVAYGVRFTAGNETVSVAASKDVILAAGAFGSPKLLELSGIGSKKILEPLGIEVVVESPSVGQNLQDHLMTGISYEVIDGLETLDDLRRQVPEAIQAAMEEYQQNRTGPFTIGGIGSFAVMPVPDFQTDEGKAELEQLLEKNGPNPSSNQPIEQEYFDFVKSIVSSRDEGSAAFWITPVQTNFTVNGSAAQVGQTPQPGNYLTIGATLLHPFSRGHSHITSNDASARPAIDTQYFSNALDAEVFARHIQFIERLAQSPPLRALIKDPVNGRRINAPLAAAHTLEQARAWAKAGSVSNWHPVGTCAMLPREKGGVVGGDLRVHGVERGLRVVDSSVIPVITRANTQSTVYAVAERAADIILGEG